jgi:hypothetical protein
MAMVVILAVQTGGPRVLAPALALTIGPVIAINTALSPTYAVGGHADTLLSASTYFQVMPLRVVLPAAVILATFLMLKDRRFLTRRGSLKLFLLGLLTGATVLNNPDFGLPVAASVALSILLATTPWRKGISYLIVLVAGSFTSFALYDLVGRVIGKTVKWDYWIVFQRTFGTSGYMNEPMQPFGLHVAVVALFLGSFISGLVLVVRSRNIGWGVVRRQGLAALLVGLWSLLSLPYFSGRSYAATLVGGYAFTIGMNIAVLLPHFRRAFRSVMQGKTRSDASQIVAAAFGIVAIVGVGMSWGLVRLPQEYLSVVASNSLFYSSVAEEEEAIVRHLNDPSADRRIRELVAAKSIGQALDNSSMIELLTGLPSVGSAKMPDEYMSVSDIFAQIQCQTAFPKEITYVLLTNETANLLREYEPCGARFEFNNEIFVDDRALLVKVRQW